MPTALMKITFIRLLWQAEERNAILSWQEVVKAPACVSIGQSLPELPGPWCLPAGILGSL
jgi:hypothetical protein